MTCSVAVLLRRMGMLEESIDEENIAVIFDGCIHLTLNDCFLILSPPVIYSCIFFKFMRVGIVEH